MGRRGAPSAATGGAGRSVGGSAGAGRSLNETLGADAISVERVRRLRADTVGVFPAGSAAGGGEEWANPSGDRDAASWPPGSAAGRGVDSPPGPSAWGSPSAEEVATVRRR
ncbi:MAG: hypothetical protein LBJ08_02045, partial [Bifidobacteriaceae bacterium]|nr:hypothetical protein [Bifidobacteriaceae bacterium]